MLIGAIVHLRTNVRRVGGELLGGDETCPGLLRIPASLNRCRNTDMLHLMQRKRQFLPLAY